MSFLLSGEGVSVGFFVGFFVVVVLAVLCLGVFLWVLICCCFFFFFFFGGRVNNEIIIHRMFMDKQKAHDLPEHRGGVVNGVPRRGAQLSS